MREPSRNVSAETIEHADAMAIALLGIIDAPDTVMEKMEAAIMYASRYQQSRITDASEAHAKATGTETIDG